MSFATTPRCNDERVCFGKVRGRCGVLVSTYPRDKKCPFNKPEREITNGVYYELKRMTHGEL